MKKPTLYTWIILILCISFGIGMTSCGKLSDNNSENVEDEALNTETDTINAEDTEENSSEQLRDKTNLQQENTDAENLKTENAKTQNAYDFTVSFAGDMNFSEGWPTTEQYHGSGDDITQCISPDLIEKMRDSDIMCINNEFTYSNNGAPLDGKMYTFRANPSSVSILDDLGVDIVDLANNHVYDYGKQAMIDTLDTLENAGIQYIGAGHNLSEATTPVYREIGDKTIAFVAASRAEKYKMTPQATEEEPGILRCYEPELFLQEITEAKENADFVIAYVHWGTEHSYDLDEAQMTTGKAYLDAGADAVIGAHPHCLQGMEYYDGKPIIYSLGNFWFYNEQNLDTMMVTLRFSGDDENQNLSVQVIPAMQSDCKTTLLTGQEDQERIYNFLEDHSTNIAVDEDGFVTEK